jgi:hypothetical protein
MFRRIHHDFADACQDFFISTALTRAPKVNEHMDTYRMVHLPAPAICVPREFPLNHGPQHWEKPATANGNPRVHAKPT